MKSKNLIVFFLLCFLAFAPVVVLGQGGGSDQPLIPSGLDGTKLKNPIKADDLMKFIKTILEAVIKIGLPVVALAIVYSGFLFVFARGNPGEIETAKKALLYSLIGAALLLGAWTFAQIISETVLSL